MMRTVQLARNQPLHLAGQPIKSVYFPLTAVISFVCILEDGHGAELCAIGSEGMAGLPAVLEARSTPFQMTAQIAGTARQLPAKVLSDEVARCVPFQARLLSYQQAFLDQIAQSVACGRHHSISQRMATWLLTTSDRASSACIPMTQEMLGFILGVTRPRISLTAEAFQKAGLIRYFRGIMTIVDRAGIEAEACECYQVIHDEYARLQLI
jgi:CRP-like cAMP-binding protein